MAGRPPNPLQTMETQTRFDLNRELAHWGTTLAAREGLTPERVRELETHLVDAIAAWEEKGLTTKEACWIAMRRMGNADALSAQFAQADPGGLWRTRLFWMVVGILVVPLLQFLTGLLGGSLLFLCAKYSVPVPGGVIALLASVLFIAGMTGLFKGLAAGRWPRLSIAFEAFCSRRRQFPWQFIVLAAMPMLIMATVGATLWLLQQNGVIHSADPRAVFEANPAVMNNMRFIFFSQTALWPVVLAILAAKYAPRAGLTLGRDESASS